MKPDTWEDLRVGGAKLKAKGTPIGIGLGHSVDPNVSYRSMLWSYGASECDETRQARHPQLQRDARGREARSRPL